MVDREDAVQILHSFEELADVGDIGAGQPEVDELGCAVDICVSLKGRDLTSGHEQQLIEVRLQFAHRVKVGDRVVVADRNKIEASSGRGLYRFV